MNLIVASFLAGVVTVATPCVLPLIPVIMAGSVGNKLRPLAIVLGMSVTFSVMGIVTSKIGWLFAYYIRYFRGMGDILIIFLGLLLVSDDLNAKFALASNSFVSKIMPAQAQTGEKPGVLGGLVLGLSLGVAWIPCIGPILGSVLTGVAIRGDIFVGGLSLFSYSLGIGIPMLIVAYAGKFASENIKDLAKYGKHVKKAAGVVLILTGISMLLGIDRYIQALLLPYFPLV